MASYLDNSSSDHMDVPRDYFDYEEGQEVIDISRQVDANLCEEHPQSSNAGHLMETASKKRKSSTSPKFRTHKRRRVPIFDYVQLLNTEINDAKQRPSIVSEERYPPLKHRGVTWGASEKSIFYRQLARSRQNVVYGAGDLLESKSEIEMLDLQDFLKQETLEWENHKVRQDVFANKKYLSAVEIEEDCCEALNEAADTVALFQWEHERQEEARRFRPHGLLVTGVVEQLEELVRMDNGTESYSGADHGSPSVRPDLIEAINHLRLRNWLQLSERIFMNVPVSDQLQAETKFTDIAEQPSMFASAFVDYYNLLLSITKRIISTTIFCSMSRQRASGNGHIPSKELLVQERDVLTALDLLGMQANSRKFWNVAARRLNIEVYSSKVPIWRSTNGGGYYDYVEDAMSYEAVESSLPGKFHGAREEMSKSSPRETNQREASQHLLSNINSNGAEQDSDQRRDEESDSEQDRNSEDTHENRRLEEKYDAHLEELDRAASTMEEYKLWQVLKAPRDGVEAPHVNQNIKQKPPRRKMSVSTDWRDQSEFRAEWERYGGCLPRDSPYWQKR